MPTRQFTAGEYPLGCPGWSVSEAAAPPIAPVTRASPRPRVACESCDLHVMTARWAPLGAESPGPLPRQEQTAGAAAGDLGEPGEHRAGGALEETGGCAPRLLERFGHDVVGFAPVDEDAVGKGIHRPPMPSHQLSQGLDISLGDLANHAPVGR